MALTLIARWVDLFDWKKVEADFSRECVISNVHLLTGIETMKDCHAVGNKL